MNKPFLLVNIGSGISILHVESETRYQRISGTRLVKKNRSEFAKEK